MAMSGHEAWLVPGKLLDWPSGGKDSVEASLEDAKDESLDDPSVPKSEKKEMYEKKHELSETLRFTKTKQLPCSTTFVDGCGVNHRITLTEKDAEVKVVIPLPHETFTRYLSTYKQIVWKWDNGGSLAKLTSCAHSGSTLAECTFTYQPGSLAHNHGIRIRMVDYALIETNSADVEREKSYWETGVLREAAPFLHQYYKLVTEFTHQSVVNSKNYTGNNVKRINKEMQRMQEESQNKQWEFEEQAKLLIEKSFAHHDKLNNNVLDKDEAASLFSHVVDEQLPFLEMNMALGFREGRTAFDKMFDAKNMLVESIKSTAGIEKKKEAEVRMEERVETKMTQLRCQLEKKVVGYYENKPERDSAAFRILSVTDDAALKLEEVMDGLLASTLKNKEFLEALGVYLDEEPDEEPEQVFSDDLQCGGYSTSGGNTNDRSSSTQELSLTRSPTEIIRINRAEASVAPLLKHTVIWAIACEDIDEMVEAFFFKTKEEAAECNAVITHDQCRIPTTNYVLCRSEDSNEWHFAKGFKAVEAAKKAYNMFMLKSQAELRHVEQVRCAVQAIFDYHESVPANVACFPELSFDALQSGDVLLMNTNGPPAGVGKLMGFLSPAGQLELTHTALCYEVNYQNKAGHALLWEMFEFGADIRPMQGHPRLESRRDAEYDAELNKLMIIRYVGLEAEAVRDRVKMIAKAWYEQKECLTFPSLVQLYAKGATTPWYTAKPDQKAYQYAMHGRSAISTTKQLDDSSEINPLPGDEVQFCSSLVCATWQAALGSLAEKGTDRETELLSRLPMKAACARPTDWSLLPSVAPESWRIVGIVTGFSEKRSFNWFDPYVPKL